MLKDIRWKFVAVVAILAMAVSLLSGGLSGVGFGTLMLRALIGGVLFAVLATGVNILISMFFPELLDFYDSDSGFASVAGSDSEDDTGSRVDIVMPAESPSLGGDDESSGSPSVDGDGNSASAADMESVDDGDNETGSVKEPMGDLDRFSSDFSEVGEDTPGKSPRGGGIMEDHDVEELAQAIHTVVIRDEKG